MRNFLLSFFSLFLFFAAYSQKSPDRTVEKEMKGNWFNKQTGDWELSFFDNVAVYKNKVWQLSIKKFKLGEGSVSLRNEKQELTLFLKKVNKGVYMIGESSNSLKEFCTNPSGINFKSRDVPYKVSVFKNDSAVFSGYIKGYTQRKGIKTASLYFRDILTGLEKSLSLNIADDGSFRMKVPLFYPHTVDVSSGIFNASVFLEPGNVTFMMVDLDNLRGGPLFMGDCGRLNMDLQLLENLNVFDYMEMHQKVLELVPQKYKEWLLDLKQKDLDTLKKFSKEHALSAKAYQIKRLEIEYAYAGRLLGYSMDFEKSYKQRYRANTVPKIHEVNADHYNFITNEIVNNPIAVVTDEYSSFLNRLKEAEIFKDVPGANFTIFDQIAAVGDYYSLNEEEEGLLEAIKKNNLNQSTASENEFYKKYAGEGMKFYQKYMDLITESGKKIKKKNIQQINWRNLYFKKV